MKQKKITQYRKTSPVLHFLYKNKIGRLLLKGLVRREVSQRARSFFCSSWSRLAIPLFIRQNKIDMAQYQEGPYRSFNDFFIRQVKPGKRPIDPHPQHLISPCDAKATAYPIDASSVWHVKGTDYSLAALLCDEALAKQYEGGVGVVLRLSPDDYHRYCYIDEGSLQQRTFIPGQLHTVQPIAEKEQVFAVNCREYTQLKTQHFGEVLQMEVGAVLVGKIVNYHENHHFYRGEEKGRFEYGGSTILLFFEKDRVQLHPQLFRSAQNGREVKVKMGQKIGWATPAAREV
ncbi:MAG: phosphatidylserine decarboxylase [Lachnospiraceae bacterium]|jgi:phosphatidylserine decarboxylase|nr:phosphatidylserine decarboxylase [Lachnospiraceae bacterium]